MRTDRTVPNNKPDITIKKEHVAIYGDRNLIKKEIDKVIKCKGLAVEIHHVWNVKAKVIPVIIGATGPISKSLRQYLNNVPGNTKLRNYKKTTILCAPHYCGKC